MGERAHAHGVPGGVERLAPVAKLARGFNGGCGAGSAKTKATETKAWGPRVSGTEAGALAGAAGLKRTRGNGPQAGLARGKRKWAE